MFEEVAKRARQIRKKKSFYRLRSWTHFLNLHFSRGQILCHGWKL